MILAAFVALAGGASPRIAAAGEDADEGAPRERTGLQAALRVGYARPVGSFEVWRDLEIHQAFREQVPLLLEVGYKPFPAMFVGVFGSVAPGTGGERFEDLCDDPGCDPWGFRFGAEIAGHFRPGARFDPWIGFGMGGEVSSLGIHDPAGDVVFSVRGFDFAILQMGADVRISRLVGAGPFLQYAFGVYTDRRVSTPRYTEDASITDTEVHGWLTAGLRVVLFP